MSDSKFQFADALERMRVGQVAAIAPENGTTLQQMKIQIEQAAEIANCSILIRRCGLKFYVEKTGIKSYFRFDPPPATKRRAVPYSQNDWGEKIRATSKGYTTR